MLMSCLWTEIIVLRSREILEDIEADRSWMLRKLLSIQAKTGLNLFAIERPVLDIRKNPSWISVS